MQSELQYFDNAISNEVPPVFLVFIKIIFFVWHIIMYL